MKYDVVRVRYGAHQKYLDDGYEPFGVTSEDTSYDFLNTSLGKRETHYQSSDYIYLRKRRENELGMWEWKEKVKGKKLVSDRVS